MSKTRSTFPLFVAVTACCCLVPSAVGQGEKKIEQMKETGEFTAATPKDKLKPDFPVKLHALQCVAGRTYTIDLRSDEFDPYLRLENANGVVLKEDDDSGGGSRGTDARIVFKADQSAPYTLVATSYLPGAKGKYTLTVTHDGAAEKEVKYLLDVKAKLTKDDPKEKDRGGFYHKAYKIDMAAKSTYVIQLDSRDFDAYLRLLDATGKEVANDDDGAKDGLNAKLVFPCQKAGTYTILATTANHPDTGEFHLRVSVKE